MMSCKKDWMTQMAELEELTQMTKEEVSGDIFDEEAAEEFMLPADCNAEGRSQQAPFEPTMRITRCGCIGSCGCTGNHGCRCVWSPWGQRGCGCASCHCLKGCRGCFRCRRCRHCGCCARCCPCPH